MEQKIKIFENGEFGKVRTIIKDGEPWFVGKDVAKILEYRNTKKALSDHVDEEDKYQGDGVTIRDPMGRVQHPTIINESGLYSLILSSKMPRAKEFKHWVTSEILPTIRRTGGYVASEDMFIENYLPFLAVRQNFFGSFFGHLFFLFVKFFFHMPSYLEILTRGSTIIYMISANKIPNTVSTAINILYPMTKGISPKSIAV